jgi:hypothetical protein
MRHLDDVTSADTGRRPLDNLCECKSPFPSLKRCQGLTAALHRRACLCITGGFELVTVANRGQALLLEPFQVGH